MRGTNNVFQPEQGVLARRLFNEHIECRTAKMPALQRRMQGQFINQSATGAIDQ